MSRNFVNATLVCYKRWGIYDLMRKVTIEEIKKRFIRWLWWCGGSYVVCDLSYHMRIEHLLMSL